MISLFLIPSFIFGQGRNCMLESKKNEGVLSKQRFNILGTFLKSCSTDPLTGWSRDGSCHSDKTDRGNHSVCAILTEEFLLYTKAQGNDLSTPNPRYGFPGLKPGNKWCLCAARWEEAKKAGIELDVDLEASSVRALEVTSDFQFDWKFRVVECEPDLYSKQKEVFKKDDCLKGDLKLIAIPIKGISGCRLRGLDGDVKDQVKTFYTLSELEKLINKMPMRMDELQNTN